MTSEIIAIFEDGFSRRRCLHTATENQVFSDDDSGGKDPDLDVIQLSGNQQNLVP